jgi:uncharacterized coiled-coil protein SlyX
MASHSGRAGHRYLFDACPGRQGGGEREGDPSARQQSAAGRRPLAAEGRNAAPAGAAGGHGPHAPRIRRRQGTAPAPIDARAEAEERRRIAASPEVRAALREIAIDNAAEALARHNLEHLRRLKLFRALINRFGQLLWDAVAPIPEGDEAAATRAAKARRLLLAGRGDGIARNLVAYARLLESLQRQTHKALGLEDRVRRAEPPGPPPVPPRTAALPALDLSQLSDAEMEALKTVAALLEDTRGEQPAPASR